MTLDSIEENGTSLSCGVEALSWGWEKWLSLMTPVFQAVIETVEECHSALQHLPGYMQFMVVNDGWRGGENVTKTPLYLRQMPWKGAQLSERDGGLKKKRKE